MSGNGPDTVYEPDTIYEPNTIFGPDTVYEHVDFPRPSIDRRLPLG